MLAARLEGAAAALGQLQGADLAEASKEQCQATLDAFQRADITPSDVVALTEKVVQVPWAKETERRMLLNMLTDRAEQRARVKRVQQQNYESLMNYFNAKEWRTLLDPQMDFLTKAHIVVDKAISLGLRNPTEGTMGFATAFLVVCGRRRESTHATPGAPSGRVLALEVSGQAEKQRPTFGKNRRAPVEDRGLESELPSNVFGGFRNGPSNPMPGALPPHQRRETKGHHAGPSPLRAHG